MLDSLDYLYDGIKVMNKKYIEFLMLFVNENCFVIFIIWKLFFYYIKKIFINIKILSLNISYV